MSEREDAVNRVAREYGIQDPSKLPLLPFLEACQPGFRRRLDQAAADRGLVIDHNGTVKRKDAP